MSRRTAASEADIERLVADDARQIAARSSLRNLLDATPTTLAYKQWARRLPAAKVRLPVAVVSSFTIETIDLFLEVESYLSGWRMTAQYFQYGSWRNALLDPKTAGAGSARAFVLLLHDTELLPVGTDEATTATNHLEALVRQFRERVTTPLFICLVASPSAGQSIALGESSTSGRARLLLDLRQTLAEFAKSTGDVRVLDVTPGEYGVKKWYDAKGMHTTMSFFSQDALPSVARIIARNLACLFKPRRKVLVLDLDNTLWGGIVGEDGVDGVALGAQWPGSCFIDFQRQLRALRQSGVLLALNSKNDEADARAVFESRPEMVLKWDDFSARRINWIDKVLNLIEIADELSLGLDSMVFADDSAFECALVRSMLPMVEVVELGSQSHDFMNLIARTQAFDTLHVSTEDRNRAESYVAETRRNTLRARAKDSESFFAESELCLKIGAAEAKSIERIHQLMGKTNQFNLSLERHAKEGVQSLAARPSTLYSASLTDRFGDYGMIGFLHLESDRDGLRVSNMALSCRALGRGVEDASLAFCREVAMARGHKRLLATFVRGPRNAQVLEYLRRSGFSLAEKENGRVDCQLKLVPGTLPWPGYIRVYRQTSGVSE
jgi:FkbH-like protein